MSDNFAFREPAEEVARLSAEIAETKAILRDLAARLTQIERHAKRALAPSRAATAAPERAAPTKPRAAPLSPADMDALRDELVQLRHERRDGETETRLSRLTLPTLKQFAAQIGVAATAKMTKRTLLTRIAGKVNESAMLRASVGADSGADSGEGR